MAWSTPKTDWLSSDYYEIADINRWKDNIAFIHDYAETLFNKSISQETTYSDKTYSSYPLADEINSIENNLETINTNTYQYNLGTTQSYEDNGYTVDYNEINRIESATLRLYTTMITQEEIKRRLAFTLNGARYFDVAR